MTIAAAATLTLAPNTQVLFLPYHDATRGGLDSTRAELIVEGRLAAQAGGIVFRSADAGSLGADWHGLVVERGGQADVSYAAIRDGLRCLYAKMGGRVRMDAIAFTNCGKPTAPADAAKLATPAGTWRKEELGLFHPRETKITPPMNQPFERHRPFDIENRGLRLLTKVAAGTASGAALTAIATSALGAIDEPSDDHNNNPYGGLDFFIFGALIGSTVGFPIGVSLVDPYDSFVAALMGGVMPGLGGYALIGAGRGSGVSVIGGVVALCGPFIGSLSASEKSRQPPQARRISFALSPTLNGGLSAVTTLRF